MAGKAFDLPLLIRILSYVKPYKKVFAFTGVLTLLLAFLSPLRPWLIQYTVDNFIIIPDEQMLLQMTVLLIVLLILEVVVQFAQIYLANWVGQSVINDLRLAVYKKITGFRLKYFDNTPVGTMVTRTISDIETIADIFSQGILIIIGDILKLVVVVGFMFFTNWKLTLYSLMPIPLLLIATTIFKNYIKRAFQDVRTAVSKLNSFVQEHLTGMVIVQVFAREQAEFEKFKEINAEHRKAHIRTVLANAIFFPVVEILSAASIALLVWWGAGEVIDGYTTLGTLMAFILYIYMLYRPIRQLADRFNVLQLGMVSSERVFRVLDLEENIEDTGKTEAGNLKGDISFEHVWFAYKNEEWVLKDISFEVYRGQTVAFVGATGAGKSTIVNLLGRFYDFQCGSICIDGTDIRQYTLSSLRRSVGIVLQDVFLFSDTILNNITLGNPAIKRDDVVAAATMVGAHEFIMRLPGGYDFNVRERGSMLSSGQRQIIAFIRAYVYNPSILILDEATSSVDTETERMIQQAIDILTKGRTSLVIAHRLATIRKADKIFLMDDGRIKEAGSHEELMKKGGLYRNLFELQFARV